MTIEELKQYASDCGIDLSDEMIAQLEQYGAILKEWNQVMNLTGIDEIEEVREKHYLDCILPLKHVDLKGEVADVGSGAGFPGLVFAIVKPNANLTLIEPTGKRCNFLKEVVKQLNLTNVKVENERAEDYAKDHRETFDFVTARAVANLPVLSELCIPLLKKDGIFLALKGNHGEEELDASLHAMKVLGCEVSDVFEDHLPTGDVRINIVATKNKHTPKQYPRAYAKIKKKPL